MKSPNPNRVTFAGHNDARALPLAQLGQGNRAIMKETGLSAGQITYRLSKAKRVLHEKSGYRVAWRNGESQICKQIKQDVLAIIQKEIQRTLPQQIIKPEVKTVNV